MKIWRILFGVLGIIMGVTLVLAVVYCVWLFTRNEIQVFDLTNFLCTFLFSLIAILFSGAEMVRQKKEEKQEKKKQEVLAQLRKLTALSIEKRMDVIRKIQPVGFGEKLKKHQEAGDHVTYSDLSLAEMKKLFESFYYAKNGLAPYSFHMAVQTFASYTQEAKYIIDMILQLGVDLPFTMGAAAISLDEEIGRIRDELVVFEDMIERNNWTVLIIEDEENSIFGRNEWEKRKYLYEECCGVYLAFNRLLNRVNASVDRLEALQKAIDYHCKEGETA